MPYLFEAACEAHRSGVPMMRAMMMEFPDDPACATLDRQYMLGPSILVAPVFSEDGVVEYYVPAGTWTSLIDGSTVEGPGWKRETHGYLSLPLLIKPNSVIPIGARNDRPDYDLAEDVTLQVYALEEGQTVVAHIPNLKGETDATFTIMRHDPVYKIQRSGNEKKWRILLVGIKLIDEPVEGVITYSSQGALLEMESAKQEIEITVLE
jgi:alpha-D-xyloside xylohydrolase